jgi:hypothetical protein
MSKLLVFVKVGNDGHYATQSEIDSIQEKVLEAFNSDTDYVLGLPHYVNIETLQLNDDEEQTVFLMNEDY